MRLIQFSNLNTFAQEIKAKYAKLSALEALEDRVDALVTAGGEPNKLEGVQVNGVALAIAEKMVNILVATGTENGTISVNNANVAVAGLQALAFKANVSEADLDTALKAVLDAKATNADLEALKGRVTTAEGDIATLKGDAQTAGSVDYKIAQAIATIVDNPDEAMNSINELVTWINDHATDALELSNQVTTNKNDIAALTTLIGNLPEGATSTTVVGYIAEAIGALGIGDYAKTTEVTAAINAALVGYATEDFVTGKVNELANGAVKANTDAIGDMSDFSVMSDDGAITVTTLAEAVELLEEEKVGRGYVMGIYNDALAHTDSSIQSLSENYDGQFTEMNIAIEGKADKTDLDAYVKSEEIETVTEDEIRALLAD